jgi:myo-inositol-1(or 4)-monophosphatase
LQQFPEDLPLLRDAVADAATVAGTLYERGFESWKKSAEQPVTDVDMAVNACLEGHLRPARPDYGWLSEETRDDERRLSCRRVFVIDPIDGTRALMRRQPHFVISAALVEDGRPVIGILHNPVTGERFEAVEGKGATRNGEPIGVTDCPKIEAARLFAYAEFVASRRWRQPWPQIETGMVNSIAYRLALVAAGRYDGCITTRSKNDWDLAAADLILREAGGIITDRNGKGMVFNRVEVKHAGVLAAGPALHALLLEKMGDWE